MSDATQGPGWWQASDGKWYPPEQHPGQSNVPQAPVAGWGPTSSPPAGPKSHGVAIAVGVVAVVVAVAVVGVLFAGGSGSDTDTHQATPSAKPHADIPKGYTEFSD